MSSVISVSQTAFLKYEIENGSPRRKKTALQDVTRLYRLGYALRSDSRNAFEQLINGIVLAHADPKVVRWCLNALARFGTRNGCSRYVELALKANDGNPEIVAAAVAALSRLYNGRLNEVRSLINVDPVIKVLAALQITEASKLDLSGVRINIDTADPEVLKLALVTVGLNRDVENLFDPKHTNGSIIKALGSYPDPIVRQYCVWCVIENRKLSIADLGMSFANLEDQPSNVQSKLLQLALEQIPREKEKHDIIHRGSLLDDAEARGGLAKALTNNYYDGLEEVTIGWFDIEDDFDIKLHLAEHIARFSEDCPPYFDKACSINESDADGRLRQRLLLGAEKKELYLALKGETQEGTLDMFQQSADLNFIFRGKTESIGRKMLKALMLAAAPVDQQPLRLDEEARDLQEALRLVEDPQVDIQIVQRWAVRTNQLQMEVMNTKPQILHFSGHGDSGCLLFEDVLGNTAEVSADSLAELVELSSSIECLLLNACYSESVARQCVPHVKAVIGCSVSVGDAAAVAFTRSFYRALRHGEAYERAFRLAKNEVRINYGNSEADNYVILT